MLTNLSFLISSFGKTLPQNLELDLKMRCKCDRCAAVLGCTEDCGSLKLSTDAGATVLFNRKLVGNGNIRILMEVKNEDELKDKFKITKCHWFHTLHVGKSFFLNNLASVCGWIYLAAWMVAFYPQVITNFNKKSVSGLNLDFVCLNVTGMLLFCLFFLKR